jgi:hypothetical protein
MSRVSLSDQCKIRYYELVALFNDMQDTPLLRVSPIRGKRSSLDPGLRVRHRLILDPEHIAVNLKHVAHHV